MIGLVFLIGLKITAPVLRVAKIFVKGVTVAPESDNNKTDKEGDNDQYTKNKEYFNPYSHRTHDFFSYTLIIHGSQYTIDYKSSYYYQITTPPPDISLQHLI